MITIDLLSSNFIVTVVCLIVMWMSNKFGDSSTNLAWMIFLGPLSIGVLVVYWLDILLNFIISSI